MSEGVTNIYPPGMVADLAKSGLTPGDIKAKPLTAAEKSATSTPLGLDGYVIPYFDMRGIPLPFYRVKLFSETVKYRQLLESPNHVYFPPRLPPLLAGAKYIIITEGEKKAAAAVKAGFPAVALGGVDSWKSRNIALPKDAQIAQKPSGQINVRLPQGAGVSEEVGIYAKGFSELIDWVVEKKIPILIAYDTEALGNGKFGIKQEVQRACATLAFELRHRGVPLQNIRQLVLPSNGRDKVGLDDLLGTDGLGAPELAAAIKANLELKSAFPRHPNVRKYLNDKLQKHQMPRSEQIGLSYAVLSDLDARGQRLRDPSGALYYFFQEAKTLSPVEFTGKPEFADTPFGRHLYREYNIGLNDARLLGWLATQYAAEDPISEVRPERVMAWRGDTLYYQINDGSIARVTRNRIDLIDNGEDGVLFEAGMVEPLGTEEFGHAIQVVEGQPLENWWYEVLKQCRIKESEGDRQRKLLSLLYYISPLFLRWQGTQLPVEITTGEAGSGKSTLYELRLSILTGVPSLRNAPSDLKDWSAGLASTGALHVTDNVQFTNNDLRQKLSDEICRLVTEPNPTIEQRKLYTNTGIVKIPVTCVFAITAIKQPFQNVDIIQRSIITTLDKGTDADLKYDASWKQHQIEGRGGRSMWLAHQLVFVQRVLQLISAKWNKRYQARFRLINLEQLLQLAAQVAGWDSDWIAPHLESSRDQRASETDWTLSGLLAFANAFRRRWAGRYLMADEDIKMISEWAQGQEEFAECQILVNPRMLGRYFETHKHIVATTTNLVPRNKGGDSWTFLVRDPESPNDHPIELAEKALAEAQKARPKEKED